MTGIVLPFNEQQESKVDGSKILDRVAAFLLRFVNMSRQQADIEAAWTAHTHAFRAARETPYLAIYSAEKQSGKTRLLEVLELLVNKPWLTGKVTAACLIRKIDAVQPTLLLDESDAAFKGAEEYAEALRGVLNTGHREGGKASCCVGQGVNISYKDFKTYCPKAIAGIGKNLPDTVQDRSIPIVLKRQSRGERVERFRRRDIQPEAEELRTQLSEWLSPLIAQLREARPQTIDALSDRRQDGLEPLLAIADAAGGDWPQRIREAAVTIFTSSAGEDDSQGVLLLTDIRNVFQEQGIDKISSEDLIAKLREVESSPWGDWNGGRGITKNKLARLLKKYEIQPRTIRVEERIAKGYPIEAFSDAWDRYLSPVAPKPALQLLQPSQPASLLHETHFSEALHDPSVTVEKSASDPHEYCIVTDVTVQNPEYGPERVETGVHGKPNGRTLPSCPACGGYALYRLPEGGTLCQKCGKTFTDSLRDNQK